MKTLLVLASFFLFASGAVAQPCRNADLRGVYLLQASGWQNSTDPNLAGQMVPMLGLGLLQLDGGGNGSGQFTVTVGGTPATFEFAGFTYTVNNDCTASAEYQLKSPGTSAVVGPDRHKLLVIDDGNLVRTLMTDSPGRTSLIVWELRRLSRGPRTCNQSMIRGTYALHYDGWINMQLLNPKQSAYFAPMMAVGQVRIDPDGVNSGGASGTWGGIPVDTELVTGNWKVNADCTGIFEQAIRVKGSNQTMSAKLPLVAVADGSELFALGVGTPAIFYYVRIGIP